MKFDELQRRTGQEARFLRYLIGQGIVPPPVGGRKMASYGEEHVAAVESYVALRQADVPRSVIQSLQDTSRPLGGKVSMTVAPGVAILLNFSSEASLDPDHIGQQVTRYLKAFLALRHPHEPS